MKTIRQNTRLQAILQATTLFGFALYFTGAVISGAAYRYVHERHIPMLLFSAVVFFLIGMLKLKKVMQESHWRTSLFNNGYTGVSGYSGKDARSARAGVFSIVVFAVALVGMSASSGIAVRFSQFAYSNSLGGQPSPVSDPPFAADAFSAGEYSAAPPSDAVSDPASTVGVSGTSTTAGAEPNMKTADSGIVMDSDTFTQWLTELYTKPDAWVGKKITATGSVWKDGELFEKNEFALARMMMICCAADMQPVGILAQWSDVQTLIDGEWIEVSGTLSKKPYKNSFDPLIIVETIKKVNQPQREYIYP
jgi:TIGR03943 family protein